MSKKAWPWKATPFLHHSNKEKGIKVYGNRRILTEFRCRCFGHPCFLVCEVAVLSCSFLYPLILPNWAVLVEVPTTPGERATAFQLNHPSQLVLVVKEGVVVEHFLQQKWREAVAHFRSCFAHFWGFALLLEKNSFFPSSFLTDSYPCS